MTRLRIQQALCAGHFISAMLALHTPEAITLIIYWNLIVNLIWTTEL